uniref:Uncharacterized protein n=1 Tax=Steinernema glaseri TaxID=37863 RepID=A0A1I7Y533_9BILA
MPKKVQISDLRRTEGEAEARKYVKAVHRRKKMDEKGDDQFGAYGIPTELLGSVRKKSCQNISQLITWLCGSETTTYFPVPILDNSFLPYVSGSGGT